ncbi:MAG: hypothetical protein ACTHL8_10355 [Burkholderiaceae bacterium]
MFQLPNFLPVKVAGLSLPARKKGAEIVHTTDIVVEHEGANDVLDLFDAELLDMLYREIESEAEEKQLSLDSIQKVSKKPVLRTAALQAPIALSLKWVGYELTIDRGLGGDSNIVVDEIEIKRIRIWPKEGGTVKVMMHLQSKHVGSVQVGQLRELLKLETKIRLLAPKVKQDAIDGSTEAFEADKAANAAAAPAPKTAPRPPARKPTKAEQQAAAREAATAAFAGAAH